jgi:hypothetical protein
MESSKGKLREEGMRSKEFLFFLNENLYDFEDKSSSKIFHTKNKKCLT